jgi:hypothetical protein
MASGQATGFATTDGTGLAPLRSQDVSPALTAALIPRVLHLRKKREIIRRERPTMQSFLIFSGVLATLVGLAAVIEGNLQCLGIIRRVKNQP